MKHPDFVEQVEPESVFGVLSDDSRVEILRVLWEADDELSFSELHDAVGIRDSGQFNYYLDKLVGQFVASTDDGYELTAAGAQINGAIEAGSYTTRGAMDPVPLDSPCPTSGGPRTFHYEDELARVDCEDCTVQASFPIPPSAFVDCDQADVPDVAGRYLQTIVDRLNMGFCSQCDGPVERTVRRLVDSSSLPPERTPPDEVPGDPSDHPIVEYRCRQCGMEPTSGLAFALLAHPDIVSFYRAHGIDLRDHPIWEFASFGPDREHVRSIDPFRASTSFVAGDEELTVVVDEELTVVDTERETADPG